MDINRINFKNIICYTLSHNTFFGAYVFLLFLARPGPGGPGGSGPVSSSGPGQGPPGLLDLPGPGLAVPAAVSSKSSAIRKIYIPAGKFFLLLSAPNRQLSEKYWLLIDAHFEKK